ncbi:tape measure protein [Bacteroides sp.]
MEEINFNITGNNNQILLKIEETRKAFTELGKTTNDVGKSFKKVFDAMGGADALKKFVSDVVRVRSEVQLFENSLAGLLQSKEKANALMNQVVRTAAETPFSITELASAAQQLVTYGLEAEEVNGTLMRLGEIASGVSIPLDQLATLLGTVIAQGGLSTSALEQFSSSGIPMLQGLADMFGVTTEKVNEMVAAGQVGFPEVQRVIANLTNEGGKFYGLMDAESDTIAGKIQNLADAWNEMLNAIGQSQEGVIAGSLDSIKYLVDNYEEFGRILTSLIAIYGAYRVAVMLSVEISKGYTVAQIAQYNILLLVEQAQKALNLAVLKNPYVIAAVAVVGLVSAMWALSESTSVAEQEMTRVADRTAKYNEYLENERKHIDELISVLQSESVAQRDKAEALKELQTKYPALFGKYETERQLLDDLTEARKRENEQIRNRKDLMNVKNQNDDVNRLKELKRLKELVNVGEAGRIRQGTQLEYQILYNRLNIKEGISPLKSIVGYIDELINESTKIVGNGQNVIRKQEQTAWESTLNTMDKKTAEEQKRMYEGYRIILRESGKQWLAIQGAEAPVNEDIISNRIKQLNQKVLLVEEKDAAQYQAEAKNAWLEAKQAVNDIKSSKTTYRSPEQYEKTLSDAKEKEKKARKVYEDRGGVISNSSSKLNFPPINAYEQEQRLHELQIKNIKDYARQLEELYYDVEQAKVNGMVEGSKKTLAQIELNHEKELMTIDREKEDFLQRKKDNAKAEFDAKEEIKVTQNSKYIKKEFDTSSIILSDDEIQMFDNKYIVALNRQANEKQAYYDLEKQGMNEYLKEYGTYQEKRKAITELYEDKIAKVATEGERKTLEAQRGQALSVLDVDANKKTAAFSKLFADMKDRTVEDMINIAAEAQAALDYVNAGEYRTDSEGKGFFGISKETFDLLRKSPEELEKVKQGIKDTKTEAANFDNAFAKIADGFKTLFEEGADPKKFQEGLAQIEGAMNEVMGVGKLLSNSLSSLGDAFGSDALKGIAEGMNAAMDAASATMDGVKMGFAVGGPFGAAAGAAIGLVTSLASSIAKIHDAKNEKRIQRLQEQIETLNRAYDKLGDSVEKAYSSDASQLIEQQNRLLEQQKVLIQNQIKEEQSKKNTDDGRIKEWQNQIEDINKTLSENKEKQIDVIFGQDVKSAIDDFAQAYADAWTAGDDRAKSSKDFVKNMIKQMILESIKAASSKPMEELRQRLAGFFSDGIISAWEQEQIEKDAARLMNSLDSKFAWADRFMKDEDKDEDETTREASSKGIAQASQDSVDKLDGVMTNIQGHTYSINENVRAILDSMNGNGTPGMPGTGKTADSGTNTVSLADIDRNMSSMIGLGNVAVSHLSSIADNTSRLATIEQTMSFIKLGIDTMNTKGITIKR